MDTTEYLAAINAPGVNHLGVEWATSPQPAARHRGKVLRKVSSAIVMTGAEYKNLAVNNDRTTGDLPWGTWKNYPYIVEHRGVEYARLYVVDGTLKTVYLVDGDVVSRDDFNGYLTPSQADAKRPNGGTITVRMENVRLVGETRSVA